MILWQHNNENWFPRLYDTASASYMLNINLKDEINFKTIKCVPRECYVPLSYPTSMLSGVKHVQSLGWVRRLGCGAHPCN